METTDPAALLVQLSIRRIAKGRTVVPVNRIGQVARLLCRFRGFVRASSSGGVGADAGGTAIHGLLLLPITRVEVCDII